MRKLKTDSRTPSPQAPTNSASLYRKRANSKAVPVEGEHQQYGRSLSAQRVSMSVAASAGWPSRVMNRTAVPEPLPSASK
jgi:hypothetical protein